MEFNKRLFKSFRFCKHDWIEEHTELEYLKYREELLFDCDLCKKTVVYNLKARESRE